ncbi:MAG: DUF512 domain-containing protein [Ruminococcaceae bacterium]|nr:DUF512 domain-containing protein [Oscillospiraceae bacterium]
MVEITEVLVHSRAERAGIEKNDILLSINGNAISDVLDYRFYLADTSIDIELRRGESVFTVHIDKGEYDDIGLDFATPLMDKKQRCENKCIFCFIDQLPSGLRESLYFKDDDSRLSFLHGNYITLTNLSEQDVDRIINMHITPINVSVHTTNPKLRVKMMKNKHAGEVLSYLEKFKSGGTHMRGQIVLCKGVNDGEELLRTMHDLEKLYPAMDSVSIVPAGLTKFRDGLYPLEAFTKDECREVIKTVTEFGDKCKEKHGTRLFYPADELYIKCGLPLPCADFYEDFTQIENGVGMIASLADEFGAELPFLPDYIEQLGEKHRTVSVATGAAAYDFIKSLCDRLMSLCDNLTVNVYKITNNFFGQQITVSGLLTGKDIFEQLENKELGETLVLPANTLRSEGDLFLCGMSKEELAEKLSVEVAFSSDEGCDFVSKIFGVEPF